ncbi:MAG: MFS transporter [Dehalococcoidia bacterium]
MNAPTARSSRPRIYRGWWIVATCFLSQHFATSAGGWVFGILIAPMGAELGWSRTEIVTAITVATLLGGFLAAMFGPTVDRYGPRVLMTVSLLAGGVALMLLAGVQTKWQYYAIWSLYGVATLGFSLLGPVVALANWFVRRRALAFMFFTAGSATAGIALAPLMGLVEAAYGWRFVWLLMGAIVTAIAPLAWVTIRRRPDDLGLLPDGDLEPPAPAQAVPGARGYGREWTVREALHTRAFWLTTIGFTLIGLPQWSIFVHMAPYVVSKGFSAAEGALVVSVYGVGVLSGRPLYSYIIQHYGIHRALLTFGAFYGVTILVFTLPHSLLMLEVTAVILGIAIAGGQQLQAQAFPDYFGRGVVGTLQGYSGVALTVTRAVGPLLAAFAFDRSGSYVVTFVAFGIACFLGVVVFLLGPPPVHPLDRAAEAGGAPSRI